MTSPRVSKVQSLLVREISDILAREIKDPRVQGITVVEVRATGDLRRAVVFYRIIDGTAERKKNAEEGLKSASGALKRMLGERVKLKFMPELVFRFDTSEDYAERIETLLKEVMPENSE